MKLFALQLALFSLLFSAGLSIAADKPAKRIDNYIAVFDLETNEAVEKGISFPLSESVRRELVLSGKYEVIDRGNMNKILGEQKFQLSGCVSGQCVVEAGQVLGVGKIIAGSVSKLGGTYYLSLSLINVQTGKIENISEDKCKCEVDDLIDSSKRLARRLLGEKVEDALQQTTAISGTYRKQGTASASAGAAPAYTDPAKGMEFVFVKGGCYKMGNTFDDKFKNEGIPVHEVCVNDFYMGKYDVTVGDFRWFVDDTGYITEAEKGYGCYYWTGSQWYRDSYHNWHDPGFRQQEREPVVCVSWNDAQVFASWMQKKSGKAVRLPTEAEWEYAARSGGKQEKYAGGNNVDSVAWYGGNSGMRTHPVGQKQPNGLGLYDMSGNVWKWMLDWYEESYYSSSPRNDPPGPSMGTYRVVRGGGFRENTQGGVRTAFRFWNSPDDSLANHGFRLVLVK